MINYLAPQFSIPARTTVSTTGLTELYSFYYNRISQIVRLAKSDFLALCLDIWLCVPQRTSYIIFNLHLIINNQLVRVMLKFAHLEHPHTSEHIKIWLEQVLQEFELQQKAIIYVTDEGANIVGAADGKRRLKCLGHAMHNYIAKDLVKLDSNLKKLISRCRSIVHFFHFKQYLLIDSARNGSNLPQLMDDLSSIQEEFSADESIRQSSGSDSIVDQELWPIEEADLDSTVLEGVDHEHRHAADESEQKSAVKRAAVTKMSKDMATRWSSIYRMCGSISRNKNEIISVLSNLFQNDLLLDGDEWSLLESYLELLTEFHKASNDFSRLNEPSINLVLGNRAQLKSKLSEFGKFDEKLRAAAVRQFERRFQVEEEHVIGALCDPFCSNLVELYSFSKTKILLIVRPNCTYPAPTYKPPVCFGS